MRPQAIIALLHNHTCLGGSILCVAEPGSDVDDADDVEYARGPIALHNERWQHLLNNSYIHGLSTFRQGYIAVDVPAQSPLRWRANREAVKDKAFLASSYNVPKLLIDTYGYAAFGLTVAPYAFMSVVNIFADLFMPEYPALFIVHTPDLDKAIEKGAVVDGVVAEVDAAKMVEPIRLERSYRNWQCHLTM
ncbi:hypothetical protein B0H63DRAFT_505775 [Podospora didyma]|uniref:Uncharacterized protein n=1 Tax=Podospora didyma TaxID=330526 RepID=A0AAE0U806_9PEZI|nr:hypothetical protein B0H63DRAFT_505775 [Podospora didyma]